MTDDGVQFRRVPMDHGDGAAMEAAMAAEMAELYDGLDIRSAAMPAASAAQLGPPHGVFLVGYRAGVPVAGGGLKRLPDGACEIKRIFVVAAERGRGTALALLAALEDAARDLGYRVARLDTGPRQPQARRLFEQQGYREIANFNANPVATFFGEKQL